MRVVHAFRGLHDYLRELVNSEADHSEVHVLVSKADLPILAGLKTNIHVHCTEMPRVRSPLNAIRLPQLASFIRQINPDIVHLQSGIVWECGLMLARRRFPIILTVHDVTNHPAWGWVLPRTPDFLTARAIRSADAVIVHGESCREMLLRLYGEKGRTPRVYSVDHGVISHYGIGSARLVVPPGEGNILFFGYLQKNKGLEYLAEAHTILRPHVPGLSTVVAGAASDQAYYRRLLGKTPGVSLRMGHQDGGSVEQLFRWADVVVLPYVEASQSGVLQIATAFGVPSVVTRVGGLPDVIHDRQNGILVSPRDSMLLATAIRELLSDPGLRAGVIGNLHSDRENRFSWPRIASQTLDIYQDVINRFRDKSLQTIPTSFSSAANAGQ